MLTPSRKRLALGVLCIFLVSIVFVNQYLNRWTGNVDPGTLESEIRDGLPVGSSISTVDKFLISRGIEHGFQSSTNTGYAVVRQVKGSNALIREDLDFKFKFDNAQKLTSIEAKKVLTGP